MLVISKVSIAAFSSFHHSFFRNTYAFHCTYIVLTLKWAFSYQSCLLRLGSNIHLMKYLYLDVIRGPQTHCMQYQNNYILPKSTFLLTLLSCYEVPPLTHHLSQKPGSCPRLLTDSPHAAAKPCSPISLMFPIASLVFLPRTYWLVQVQVTCSDVLWPNCTASLESNFHLLSSRPHTLQYFFHMHSFIFPLRAVYEKALLSTL